MRISDWSSDVCSSDLNSLEQVAFVPVEELAQIEGFDEEVAEELRARARAHLEELDRHNEERRRELGVADALTEVEGLTRSEERRVGKECGSTCRSRWAPYN